MPTVRIWLLFMMAAAVPWQADAQVCKIEPTQAFRGDPIRLSLPAGTTAKNARVSLRSVSRPSAAPVAPVATQTAPPEYGQNGGDLLVAGDSTSFIVAPDAPLGRYTVAVTLDGQAGLTCGTLQVALPDKWRLAVSE